MSARGEVPGREALPAEGRARIERLLPSVIRRTIAPGTPLATLTAVIADLYDPAEAAAGALDAWFDPWRCPAPFLPLLATWLDLPLPVTTGSRRLRALIAAAVGLHQARGTLRALRALLVAATGVDSFEIDEDVRDDAGRMRAFVVAVRAPAATRAHAAMIERLIERERPAQIRCELSFEPASPPTPAPAPGGDAP